MAAADVGGPRPPERTRAACRGRLEPRLFRAGGRVGGDIGGGMAVYGLRGQGGGLRGGGPLPEQVPHTVPAASVCAGGAVAGASPSVLAV